MQAEAAVAAGEGEGGSGGSKGCVGLAWWTLINMKLGLLLWFDCAAVHGVNACLFLHGE